MKLPQLSLRELFLLIALVAMGCGWWVDRRVLVTYIRGLQTYIDRHSDGRTIRINAWPY